MGHVAGYVTELVGCITYKKYPFTESEDVHAFRDYLWCSCPQWSRT